MNGTLNRIAMGTAHARIAVLGNRNQWSLDVDTTQPTPVRTSLGRRRAGCPEFLNPHVAEVEGFAFGLEADVAVVRLEFVEFPGALAINLE